VTVADILLTADKAVPIGLIVNELVTNAFKYAFSAGDSGMVAVRLERTAAKSLTLIIEDNGKGCPEDIKEGLGSRIVRLLAQQLKGTLKREPANPGCRVMLHIP
jgi:two-component sensor histidine kinase